MSEKPTWLNPPPMPEWLEDYCGVLLTPHQKKLVVGLDPAKNNSHHSVGLTFMGARGRMSVLPPGQQTISWHWLGPDPEPVMSLYDHKVFVERQYDYGVWGRRTRSERPAMHRCSCGWKNTGYDSETRAKAHLAKLRAWLDEHPEEEVMAGLGGKITWPSMTSLRKNAKKRKAWNKKRR